MKTKKRKKREKEIRTYKYTHAVFIRLLSSRIFNLILPFMFCYFSPNFSK